MPRVITIMWTWFLKPIIAIALFVNGIVALINLPRHWETVSPFLTPIYSDPIRLLMVVASFGFIVWLYWPQIKTIRGKPKTIKPKKKITYAREASYDMKREIHQLRKDGEIPDMKMPDAIEYVLAFNSQIKNPT